MSITTTKAIVVFTLVANIGLSIALTQTSPDRSAMWISAQGLFVPVVLVGALLLGRLRGKGCNCAKSTGELLFGIALAGVIIMLSATLALLRAEEIISESAGDTLIGFVIGAVLIIIGNRMPKILPELGSIRCDPAAEQSLRRFSGWVFVFIGLGYIGAWVFLGEEHFGRWIAMSIVAIGAAVVILRAHWVVSHAVQTPPAAS